MRYFIILILWIVNSSFLFNKSNSFDTIQKTVIIKNIRSTKGSLSIGVFKDASSFDKEKPYKSIWISKKDIVNGILKTNIHLELGTYGLSLLDDENSDAKMQYNMVGMPKEGFGFSNYYHEGFSKPNFKQFLVNINESEKAPIIFQIRYIL